MIIKELNLIGFGKYENKTIILEEGINIIYGENETGKTTLHSFIDGMFYGFLKPSVKSTIYLDEHSRFEPWEAKKYTGIIKFYHNDNSYRIERDFTKGKEETKVFMENTGEEITNTIDNGSKGKVLQPGFHFFGFNSRLYSNTVSIKQLATKTEDKLADEVRDKLINITTSLDEEISVENSVKDLDKALKEIGTIRAITSKYGATNTKIISLEVEKQRILDLKLDYEKLLDNLNHLNIKIESTQNDLNKENDELNKAKYFKNKSIFNESKELTKDLEDLNQKISQLTKYKDLSYQDYNYANNLNNNITIIDGSINNTDEQINELEIELSNMKHLSRDEDHKDMEQISEDYFIFEDLEEDKNRLIYLQNDSILEILKRDIDKNHNKKTIYLVLISLLIFAYFSSIYLLMHTFKLVLFSQILIIPFVILIKSYIKTKTAQNNLQFEILETEELEKEKKQQILDIETSQINILDKYNLESKIEFRKLYEDLKHKAYMVNEQAKFIKSIDNKSALLIEKKQRLEEEKQLQFEEFTHLLKKNSLEDLSTFEKGLKNKELYDDYLVDINNKKDLLRRILGNSNLEHLSYELNENKRYDSHECPAMETVNAKIESSKELLTELLIEKRGMEEKINQIGPNISKLVEVEEELIRLKFSITKFDNKINSIQMAKHTIEHLSKEIHNQFAPEINKKVGDIVSQITGGKYDSVRVDNSLDIGVINPVTGKIIDISSLSGGTIDQLYFSLRFGIISSMVESNLPLILDDCFIQYDDKRLENILKFLQNVGKNRQIILFSCHSRERRILERLHISYNLIKLS